MSDFVLLKELIREVLLDEVKKKKKKSKRKKRYPAQYKAKGKRRKTLNKATKLAKSDNPADRARAFKMRDDQEKKERKKKGWKNKPRSDSGKS